MAINLLSDGALVQTPYIGIKIGEYEFGTYEEINGRKKYPNYIQSLEVTKINGKVNTYVLRIVYPITQDCDPNFFEKVFSNASQQRKITFSYGDMSLPSFVYRNEEALITGDIGRNVDLQNCRISYTINAISQCGLGSTGAYTFGARTQVRPSQVIKELLQDSYHGLADLFYGMRDLDKVERMKLIPDNDMKVDLDMKTNISVLDYLKYLVDSMKVEASTDNNKGQFFVITYQDDISGYLNGPYFSISPVDSSIEHSDAYELTIGYPDRAFVTNISMKTNSSYSLYYDYQGELHPQEYVSRIDKYGNYEEVYAPVISSGNNEHSTSESNKTWWSNVTQYPLSLSLRIKGLVKPAILMNYVKLRIYFYGKLFIDSGMYIVTKQVDTIDTNGFSTELSMVRISGVTIE